MPALSSLDEYLTVKMAAEFLGVSPSTLRNWDRAGKLKPHRHPMNHYRLYRRNELEAVLRSAAERKREDG
ncbi:helix-turn-helix domain-containing protein [Singulisphaera sp. Ch08]|uniref:Helix-turn-helix domain-containing protein n=1 Tax=Singulisphaera sp. Ch08 TaxID=3120278 RepID=A0AAU7CK02_9BACT